MSSLSLTIEDPLGHVHLNGYGARLVAYDSFDLITRHRYALFVLATFKAILRVVAVVVKL